MPRLRRSRRGIDEGGPPDFPSEANIELSRTGTHASVSSSIGRDPTFIELRRYVFGENQAREPRKAGAESRLLNECHVWYLNFVNAWIEATWDSLLDSGLADADDGRRPSASSSGATLAGKRRAYGLMNHVAHAIKSRERKDLALTEIVTTLQVQGHLRRGDSRHDFLQIQMVFSLIGWLTMLYEPAPNPGSNKLQLQRPTITTRQRLRRTVVIHSFSQDISTPGQSDQPFHRLLLRFGALIPRPDDVYDSPEFAPLNDQQGWRYSGGDSALDSIITVHHVCFHTLQKIVKVRIEWVQSLNLHLEFDPGERTVKLFRYPAFCWLMARSTGSDDNLLSRLFEEKWMDGDELSGHDYDVKPRPEEFFQEILLSYRLIFGQDKRSQAAYRKESAQRDRNDSTKNNKPEDPLLRLLCAEPCTNSQSLTLYHAANLFDEVSKTYATTNFPFLGKKILKLQRFSKSQYPHGWIMLWHDRRNLSEWWTIWAVLFIGGGTIVIAIVTLAFQIMQAVYRG